MKSRKKRVFEYLVENPHATNEDISQVLEINENFVKAYISQLKTGKFIEVTMNGNQREISILAEYKGKSIDAATAEKIEFKKETYMKLLDRYMNDFELTMTSINI